MNNDDLALRRAAGKIMHHVSRGKTWDEAVARAEKSEPDLTPTDIQNASRWAEAALTFKELAALAPDDADICEIAFKAGLPVFEEENGQES